MTSVEKNRRSFQGYADVFLGQLRLLGTKTLETWLFTKTAMRELKFSWLGFTLMWAAFRRWAVVEHHRKDIDEMRSVARKSGTQPDLKAVQRYNDEVRRNRNLSMVLFGIIAVATFILWMIYRDNMVDLWGYQLSVFNAGFGMFGLGMFLLCDAIGHRYVPPVDSEYEARPIAPIDGSQTIKTIQNAIKETLWFHCKEIAITFHGHRFINNHGVEFEVHLTDKLTDEHISIMEKHMQLGRGRIKLMHNKENTAAPILRVYWSDPLGDEVKPETREPRSLSVYDGFSMFRDELGRRIPMHVLGSHQFWSGKSGSGKSSALWVFIDWLVDCRDADVYGIDLGGTVFAPYRRVMCEVGTTTERAEEILDALVEECERRVAILDAKMDAEEEMEDENWPCTEKKGDRAIFLIIDEYTKFASNKSLREKVDIIYETGRKARVHVIVSTPDATKPKMGGSTAPISHAMTKIVFATPFSMITPIFGPGSVDEGWRPDHFETAQAGNPGDSGKCYVQSAEFTKPIVQRFDRLTTKDIYARNRARRNHITGAPTIPESLMILKAAFGIHGNPEKLSTKQVLEIPAAAGWDDKALAADLRRIGEDTARVMPAAKVLKIEGKSIRGYEFAGVEAALKHYR